MKRNYGPLLLLMFFVIGLGIFWVFRHENAAQKDHSGSAHTTSTAILAATPTPDPTATPEPTGTPLPTLSPTSVPTATPQPTPVPTPVPTPEPTAEPYIEPGNSGVSVASGIIRSESGTSLNVVGHWKLVAGGSLGYKLTVDVYAESGALQAAGLWDNLTLSVDGNSVSAVSEDIYTDNNSLHESFLGSLSQDVGSGSHYVTVSWRFNGTYGGNSIDVLSGEAVLNVP